MMKPQVVIGVACDGFSITVDGKRMWISQEDDPSIVLSVVFRYLGCEVEIEDEF